ncbi:TPA: hypothetical protein ACGQ50_000871 [Enterobacter cloacae]
MTQKFFHNRAETARRAAAVRSLLTPEGAKAFFENAQGTTIDAIRTLWGEALIAYRNTHGQLPSENLLAAAHGALERQMTAMMEDTTTAISGGVLKAPVWGYFILPALLQSTTASMCTFVDASHDIVDILGIFPEVRKTGRGDFNWKEQTHKNHVGFLSSVRRFVKGTLAAKKVSFDIKTVKNVATALPIRPGTLRLAVDGLSYPLDFENEFARQTSFNGSGKLAGASIVVDYAKGTVAVDLTNADAALSAAGVVLGLECDLDEEADPTIIAEINLREYAEKVRQTRYVLATSYTIQALTDLQREQGINLETQLVTEMVDFLASEQDARRLRTALFYNYHTATIDARRAAGEALELWIQRIKLALVEESDKLQKLNGSVGINGAYCAEQLCQLLRSFPGTEFQADPMFTRTRGLRRAGWLFGTIAVYCVPDEWLAALDPESKLEADEGLFFGSDGAGHSPLVAGDGIAPTAIDHGVNPLLTQRLSLYGTELNSPNPIGGRDCQVKIKFANIANPSQVRAAVAVTVTAKAATGSVKIGGYDVPAEDLFTTTPPGAPVTLSIPTPNPFVARIVDNRLHAVGAGKVTVQGLFGTKTATVDITVVAP